MNPQLRRFLLPTTFALLVVVTILLSAQHRDTLAHFLPYHYSSDTSTVRISSASPYKAAANATLGFQKILALSTGTPWRVDGLRAAANLTGLDIEIPIQTRPPPEMVEAFEHMGTDDNRHPGHGAALAWMGHIDLIKHVVQSGYSSAWIVEDDIDWDVGLLDEIMIPMAEGVRNYTNASPDDMTTPYGGNFDVLWAGHCGEWSHDDMPYHAWLDPTVLPVSEYVGWAAVDMVRLPPGHRTTHPTTNSVCTFAYGFTAKGARKILDHAGAGKGEAFDVALSTACHAKLLKCVTIHPEIFHQYEPPGENGDFSEVDVEDHNGEGVTAGDPSETAMGHTANVRYSARCKALFGTTCQQLPG